MTRLASLIVGVLALPWPSPAAPEAAPRLVLLLAVDQLRPDRLETELPGGLGRLMREGRVYTDAVLDHAITATCPGHATMLTGRHPAAAGLPGNSFIDVEAGRTVYCVNDDAEDAAVIGGRGGRSPRNLRVTTLGDWLKGADPKSRVFSVSQKDRSAIALGGRGAEAAYWLHRGEWVGYTTSRYYLEELPDWVVQWNGIDPPTDGLLAELPETWSHSVESGPPPSRPDDFIGEDPERSRSSPHPLRDADLKRFADNAYRSPYADELTLDFATELVKREALGRGPATDLLALGLSATDSIGHAYGPYSHESWAALRQLDQGLARFLIFLQSRVGEGGLLVALTADHGVLPLPEWLEANGRSECPVPGGRAGLRGLLLGLNWQLHKSFTRVVALPREWTLHAGPMVGVSRPTAAENEVEVAEVIRVVREYLEKEPAIARVWTPDEIRASADPVARLWRNSLDPERSGDLQIELHPGCLVSSSDHGTGHGSPHLYDRRVPLIFWGPGIEPARVPGPAATVDIAPTLARQVGLTPPADLDGRALFD